MKGLTLSQREEARVQVLNQVLERGWSVPEAARVLGVSQRHGWRLLAAYRKEGVTAIAHGNRGRKPAHTIGEEVKARVKELAWGVYRGVNHTHLTELLEEREALVLSRSTVRRILATAGLKSPRRRRPPKHRVRRERYPQEGMLLQVDGSHHGWLEGRGPYLTLVGAIDDATGTVPSALFREQEDAQGYFLLLREMIQGKGIPLALYSDRHNTFLVNPKQRENLEEQLAGERFPTQFGRALRELGDPGHLCPLPPGQGPCGAPLGHFPGSAGGGTAPGGGHHPGGARPGAAGLPAPLQHPLWRAPLPSRVVPIASHPQGCAWMGCCALPRKGCASNTSGRWPGTTPYASGGKTLQLLPNLQRRSYAHARVEVQERLDGSLVVSYQGQLISTTEAPPHPVTLRAHKKARGEAPVPNVSLVVGAQGGW
ncbi:MAG: helix-turn-helix domain-containing protein [Chloroflexota bacterium]